MTDNDLSIEAVHQRNMLASPEYRREYERTQFAAQVAGLVIKYRADHGLTQTALGRMLDMHQPAVARLEMGVHEPSVATLRKLAEALDITIAITADRGVELLSACS